MRHKTITLSLAVIFVCLFASRAQAQAAAWSAGYPKPGNNAGEILVQGTSTASAGWNLTGTITATVWLKGGGSIVPKGGVTINKTTGAWSGTITGLKSGQTFNIVISIYEQMGEAQNVFSPDPKQSKAK